MENSRKFPLFLNNFWLKVIALVTMTIDHIGFLFMRGEAYTIFRAIGRLSFPLFCFMIAEGVIHTRSFKKYALRLGIMASIISVAMIGMEYIPYFGSMRDQGIIFVDLLLGAIAIYCLMQKKWYLKLLALLPLAYGVASFIASSIECPGCGIYVLWFPFFMRTQYGWYGVLLIVFFYIARLLTDVFIKYLSSLTGIDAESYKGTSLERNALNIFSMMTLVIVTRLHFASAYIIPAQYVHWDTSTQLYAMFSGVFILLYNGTRGYNKKWFQYGNYLYYPVHLIILYVISSFI